MGRSKSLSCQRLALEIWPIHGGWCPIGTRLALGLAIRQPTAAGALRKGSPRSETMDLESSTALFWILGLVPLAGLASAWLTRVSEGSERQTWCQWLFVVCLGAVGLETIISLELGIGLWFLSGTVLSLMVLAATCDVSRRQETTS